MASPKKIPISDNTEAYAQQSARINNSQRRNESRTNAGETRPPPNNNPDHRNTRSKNNTNEEEVTIKDEHLPYLRELRKNYVSRCKADKQMKYLQKCLNKGNFPKQLLTRLAPQTPTKPLALLIEWQKALVTLAESLTSLLLQYWTDHYHMIKNEIANLTKLIKDNLNIKEANLIIKICEEAETRFMENQSKNVTKKAQQGQRNKSRTNGEPVTPHTN